MIIELTTNKPHEPYQSIAELGRRLNREDLELIKIIEHCTRNNIEIAFAPSKLSERKYSCHKLLDIMCIQSKIQKHNNASLLDIFTVIDNEKMHELIKNIDSSYEKIKIFENISMKYFNKIIEITKKHLNEDTKLQISNSLNHKELNVDCTTIQNIIAKLIEHKEDKILLLMQQQRGLKNTFYGLINKYFNENKINTSPNKTNPLIPTKRDLKKIILFFKKKYKNYTNNEWIFNSGMKEKFLSGTKPFLFNNITLYLEDLIISNTDAISIIQENFYELSNWIDKESIATWELKSKYTSEELACLLYGVNPLIGISKNDNKETINEKSIEHHPYNKEIVDTWKSLNKIEESKWNNIVKFSKQKATNINLNIPDEPDESFIKPLITQALISDDKNLIQDAITKKAKEICRAMQQDAIKKNKVAKQINTWINDELTRYFNHIKNVTPKGKKAVPISKEQTDNIDYTIKSSKKKFTIDYQTISKNYLPKLEEMKQWAK